MTIVQKYLHSNRFKFSSCKTLRNWAALSVEHDVNESRRHLHKSVVDKSPGSWSLKHVVQVVLNPPVARVSPAALRAVNQRLPEQTQPSALLPPLSFRGWCTCAGMRCGQQPVPRPWTIVLHPITTFHILQSVTFGAMPRRAVHPEAGAGLISAVVAGHGITNADPNTRGMRTVIYLIDATGEPRNYQREMSKRLKICNLHSGRDARTPLSSLLVWTHFALTHEKSPSKWLYMTAVESYVCCSCYSSARFWCRCTHTLGVTAHRKSTVAVCALAHDVAHIKRFRNMHVNAPSQHSLWV